MTNVLQVRAYHRPDVDPFHSLQTYSKTFLYCYTYMASCSDNCGMIAAPAESPAIGQLAFSDIGLEQTASGNPASSSIKQEPKAPISAQGAVLITETDSLAPGQRLDQVLFHGPMEMNVRVDVGNDSTNQGELLPAPWGVDGKISELYLMKGGRFEQHVSKQSGSSGKPESETVKVLKDTKTLGTYVQNLTESDQELKRLHALRIPKESKAINFDSILKSMGLDEGCNETLIKKVACKALINSPATGYDIVGDLVVAVTRIKSDVASGGYQRRVYFFHVSHSVVILHLQSTSK